MFKDMKHTKFVYLILFSILFLFKPVFNSAEDFTLLSIYLLFFLISSIVHFSSQGDKNWFRLDVIFLFGFSIVHFQWAIMLALSDTVPRYIQYGFVNLNYMNYGTWLSVLGIICWFLGYSWLPIKNKNTILYAVRYKKLLWLSVTLFVLFVMFAGSGFLSGAIYKGEGGSGAGEGISIFIQLLLSISILVLTVAVILNSKDSKKTRAFTWLLRLDKKYLIFIIAYALLFLSVGSRSFFMQVAFTFLVMFGAIVKPISFKQFGAIIIIGAAVMTVIGLGRSIGNGENILIAGAKTADFSSGYDVTIELANSARTIYTALADVPENNDYFYGKLWLGKTLSTIPFAQNAYLELSGDKDYNLGSASYITYLRFGSNAPSGEGTALIADIYLNFGMLGVMFFMFLLGLFFKKLQNELNTQQNFYWIVFAGVFASVAFYMGRGGLFDGLRPVLWAGFLVALIVKKQKIAS